MKCAICGKPTNWDESFGKENFLACPECFAELTKVSGPMGNAVGVLCRIGELMSEAKKPKPQPEPIKEPNYNSVGGEMVKKMIAAYEKNLS